MRHILPASGMLLTLLFWPMFSAPSLAAPLDTAPPVLTAFEADTRFSVSNPTAQFGAALTITDDLSGIDRVCMNAAGPSGQMVWGCVSGGYRALSLKTRLVLDLSPFVEQGEWTVSYVEASDLAGNYFYADAEDLARLGNTEFRVDNERVGDRRRPELVKGRILTPKRSLSGHPPGLDEGLPMIGVRLRVRDPIQAGEQSSGIRYAGLEICLLNQSHCMYSDYFIDRFGARSPRLNTQGGLWDSLPTGIYHIRSIWIEDHAGNRRSLLSRRFGGHVDFNNFFPSTTIELVP